RPELPATGAARHRRSARRRQHDQHRRGYRGDGRGAAARRRRPPHVYAVVFGLVCLLLQVFLSYQRYVRYLKWLTLALLSYVVLVLTIHIPWREVATRTVSPHFALTSEYLTVIVAVFGTTISPYLFFWQASQEVEELDADPAAGALAHAPEGAEEHLNRIKVDTYLGMAFSN